MSLHVADRHADYRVLREVLSACEGKAEACCRLSGVPMNLLS